MKQILENSFLYIDTALDTYEIAYISQGEVLFHVLSEKTNNAHAENFFKDLRILKQKHFEQILSLKIPLLVNKGPGRFNALRIGLAFALTLAKTHGLNLFLINSFDIIKSHLRKFDLDDHVPLMIYAKWNHAYYLPVNTLVPRLENFDNICWENAVLCGFEKDQHKSLRELTLHCDQTLLGSAKFLENLNEIEPLYLGHQIS